MRLLSRLLQHLRPASVADSHAPAQGTPLPPAPPSRTVAPARPGWRLVQACTAGPLALRGVTLDIQPGERLALVSPQDDTAHVLARVLAGHEALSKGWLEGGEHAPGLAWPEAGWVGRQWGLVPEWTVRDHLACALGPGESAGQRAAALVEAMGLAGHAEQPSWQLPPLMALNLALARAAATSPGLILMEEPLERLPATLRTAGLALLDSLPAQQGGTWAWATRDMSAAMGWADRIALLHQGQLVQLDTPAQLYAQPCHEWVFQHTGVTNRLELKPLDEHHLALGQHRLRWPSHGLTGAGTWLFRPEDLEIVPSWDMDTAPWLATVLSVGRAQPGSGELTATLDLTLAGLAHQQLSLSICRGQEGHGMLKPGQIVPLRLPCLRGRLVPARPAGAAQPTGAWPAVWPSRPEPSLPYPQELAA